MPNKVEKIMDSIKENAGTTFYASIIESHGILEKATLKKQARYIKEVLDEIDKTGDETLAERVMKPCGYQCITNSTIEKARKLCATAQGVEEYITLLNEHHIGGGHLHMQDGKIIGEYDHCYCGLAKQAQGMSPAYCYCSAGWFKSLFSSVFKTPVKANKTETILSGSEKCIFEIII